MDTPRRKQVTGNLRRNESPGNRNSAKYHPEIPPEISEQPYMGIPVREIRQRRENDDKNQERGSNDIEHNTTALIDAGIREFHRQSVCGSQRDTNAAETLPRRVLTVDGSEVAAAVTTMPRWANDQPSRENIRRTA